MDAGRWREVEEILDAALDVPERAERERLLERACAGDADLRAEVESLLAHHAPSENFIEAPAFALAPELLAGDGADGEVENRRVGAYKLIREIGRGGMGAVFLAERADGEFRQEVALKVVRRGLADADLRRRFRHERQILASLNHPNIARLFDGGVSEDGEPYLVMEYVEGTRIDDHCERRGLPTRARLRLFLEVCRGVAYAHQHLVVHRDIKPGNILVTAAGVPKLLDFGIAKLLDPEQAGDETRTEFRAFTPDYAAPEQVSGGPVTTSADVYSLGVVLGDLLHGVGLSTRAGNAPVAPRPETPDRWTVAADPATDGKGAGGSTRTRSRRFAGGELENIVAMARHEEPARRYASAAQLAEDVQRYLDGLPVKAQKDSVTYRVRKFARRNRVGVAAAAVVILSLVLGVAATVWQARRTAEQARVAAQERDRARREAAKAERISGFLQNVLGFSDASWISSNPNRNREATIADALDEAGRRAETELADQPEVQAAVRFTLGWTYKTLSKLDAAEPHLRASLELRRQALGAVHQDTAQSMIGMGELHVYRGQFAEAEALFREAIAVYRRAREAGEVDVKWFAISLSDLGWALISKGDTAEGEAAFFEALEVGANLTGADRGLHAVVQSNIGVTRRERGDLDGALLHIEKGLEEYRRLPGGLRWEMGAALGNLANIRMLKGEYDRAEALARESLDVFGRTVGEAHQYPPRVRATLAEIHYLRGDGRRAKEEIERAIAIQQSVLSETHIDLARTWVVLGKILTRGGDLARGETYLRKSLERRESGLKPGHWMTGEAQGALGENLAAQKRFAEAELLLAESHKALEASLGPQDPRTAEAHRRLIALYEAWGKPNEATRIAQR